MKLTVEQMQARAARELSLGSRLGHTALGVVSAGMAGLTGSLWLTEPSLPLRTRIALAACMAIGLAWAAFATWVLTNRRVLFANHRIVASRMALGFTAVFLLGAIVLRERLGWGAIVVAAAMFAAAWVLLVHARRKFARLVERRYALESGDDR